MLSPLGWFSSMSALCEISRLLRKQPTLRGNHSLEISLRALILIVVATGDSRDECLYEESQGDHEVHQEIEQNQTNHDCPCIIIQADCLAIIRYVQEQHYGKDANESDVVES